ncbi:MAG TPA: hypothetical protein VFX49_00525 [Chloroflexota bacterium]|nr:hypothetical protein [Chloroflexota bacterium]
MSYEVSLVVCFQAAPGRSATVVEVARRHLALLESRLPTEMVVAGLSEAVQLLTAMAAERGFMGGTKWGMFTWGSVNSHTNARAFVEVLRPFWEDLFTPTMADTLEWGGLLPGDSVVVWYEGEDGQRAGSVEIGFGPATRAWWARSPAARSAMPPEECPQLRIRENKGLPFSLKWDGSPA